MQGFYIPKKNTSNIFCKRVCFEHAVTDELPYHTIPYAEVCALYVGEASASDTIWLYPLHTT